MKKIFFWSLPFILVFMFYFYSSLVSLGHVPIRELIIEFNNYEWSSFGTLYGRLKDIFNIISTFDYQNAFFPNLNFEFESLRDFLKVFIAFLYNFAKMITFYNDLLLSIFNFFISILLAVFYLLKDIINIIAIFVRVLS